MSELIVEAGKTERRYWRDLWQYRELFYFLAWRDILVRYKQTIVGIAWALFKPLISMLVLTFVFSVLGEMPSGGVPYLILVMAAMLPWQFFAAAMSESGNSLVTNSSMISKVYFPRLIVPASSVVTSLVDFCISAVILAVMMVIYQFAPGWEVLMLPLFVLLAFGAAFGVGVWISALMVRFRDFRIIVPFMVQFGLYVSPVGYSSIVVRQRLAEAEGWSENLLLLYYLNPMASVIDGFRWSILGGEHIVYWPGMALSAAIVAVVVVTGIRYFRKTERTFADII